MPALQIKASPRPQAGFVETLAFPVVQRSVTWPYPFPQPPNTDAGAHGTQWYDRYGRPHQGTLPEYAIFWALEQLGQDFTFQSSMMGGRATLGGAITDFIVPPGLAIRVMGEYWHYAQGRGKVVIDLIQQGQLESMGFEVINIDDTNALANPLQYTRWALEGTDRSRLARGDF